MSRSKPYARQASGAKRDTEGSWKHDLHDPRPALLQRLGSGSTSPASGSLAARLGGGNSGRELLPDSGAQKGMKSDAISYAGKELLPSSSAGGAKAARSTRGSRPRGSTEGAAFAANALGNLRRDREPSGRSRAERRDEPVAINGAARSWVRVEHLAPGTTGADVKSAFSGFSILRAEVTSRAGDRDVVVELEVPDQTTAEDLVKQYDGVSADGQKLRVSVVSRSPPPKDLSQRLASGKTDRRQESSGKMYSDQIQMLRPQAQQKTNLAARIGRR